MKPAVFLDRDGTIIEHVHHLNRPEEVRLIPGAAAAISRLRQSGFLCVVVTNQSVVGRGLLDIAGLDAIHARMDELLLSEGATLDALEYCTEVPNTKDQSKIEHPDRKPGPGMLIRAAKNLDIALEDSWMIGDSYSDLRAGENAGCRESLLVLTGYGEQTKREHGESYRSFPSLGEAAEAILRDEMELMS